MMSHPNSNASFINIWDRLIWRQSPNLTRSSKLAAAPNCYMVPHDPMHGAKTVHGARTVTQSVLNLQADKCNQSVLDLMNWRCGTAATSVIFPQQCDMSTMDTSMHPADCS